MIIRVTVHRDLDYCAEIAALTGKNCPCLFEAEVPISSLSHPLRKRILTMAGDGCYPQVVSGVSYSETGSLLLRRMGGGSYRFVKSNTDHPKDVLAALEVAFSGPE